jgi:hypothetical protein
MAAAFSREIRSDDDRKTLALVRITETGFVSLDDVPELGATLTAAEAERLARALLDAVEALGRS